MFPLPDILSYIVGLSFCKAPNLLFFVLLSPTGLVVLLA